MASIPLMVGLKPRKANMIRYLDVIRDARLEREIRDSGSEIRDLFEMRNGI